MANLESDIIGRVNRLALRPSEKNALLPLMEAVSNSIHSITDLYGADAAAKGSVSINIIRLEGEGSQIVGFDIEDNGIGFTADNFRSFRTPDSRHKEKRGGKGVGRLAWLKVFESISIESSFFEDGQWRMRAFDFRLSERDQIVERADAPVRERHQTIIRFRKFKPSFENKCPVKGGRRRKSSGSAFRASLRCR